MNIKKASSNSLAFEYFSITDPFDRFLQFMSCNSCYIGEKSENV